MRFVTQKSTVVWYVMNYTSWHEIFHQLFLSLLNKNEVSDVMSHQNIQLNAIVKTWFYGNILWCVSRYFQFSLPETFWEFLDRDQRWNLFQSGISLIEDQHTFELTLVTMEGLKHLTLRRNDRLQLVSSFCCVSSETLNWYSKTVFKLW